MMGQPVESKREQLLEHLFVRGVMHHIGNLELQYKQRHGDREDTVAQSFDSRFAVQD